MYTTAQHGMQPYNPQGPDGSPHHQLHSYNPASYNLPQQQMSLPPGAAPVSMGLPPGGLAGYAPGMQGMPANAGGGYVNAQPGQVNYGVQGNYQPPAGGQLPFQPGTTSGPQAQQMYMSGSVPQGQNQPPQPSMEYQPYNMQGLF